MVMAKSEPLSASVPRAIARLIFDLQTGQRQGLNELSPLQQHAKILLLRLTVRNHFVVLFPARDNRSSALPSDSWSGAVSRLRAFRLDRNWHHGWLLNGLLLPSNHQPSPAKTIVTARSNLRWLRHLRSWSLSPR